MNKKIILKILISISIMVILFWKIGITDLFDVLKNANLIFLVYPLFSVFLIASMKGYRWKRILRPLGSKTNLKKLIKYCFMSGPFQMITPSRSGDAVRALFIKKDIPLYKGFASVVVDRLYDIIVLLIFGLSGAFLFLGESLFSRDFLPILIVPGLFFIGIIAITNKRTSNLLFKPIIKIFNKALKNYHIPFDEFHKTFTNSFNNKKDILINLSITLLSWIVINFSIFFYFLALGVKIPVTYTILVPCLVSLGSLIPITFGGVGVREGFAVFLFGLIGINSEYALGSYLLAYVPMIFSLIIGVVLYIKNK